MNKKETPPSSMLSSRLSGVQHHGKFMRHVRSCIFVESVETGLQRDRLLIALNVETLLGKIGCWDVIAKSLFWICPLLRSYVCMLRFSHCSEGLPKFGLSFCCSRVHYILISFLSLSRVSILRSAAVRRSTGGPNPVRRIPTFACL